MACAASAGSFHGSANTGYTPDDAEQSFWMLAGGSNGGVEVMRLPFTLAAMVARAGRSPRVHDTSARSLTGRARSPGGRRRRNT